MTKAKTVIGYVLLVLGMIYVAGMDFWTWLATGVCP